MFNRRQFGLLATGGVASLLIGCRRFLADMPNDGRLSVRPTTKTERSTATGDVVLDFDSRHAILRLPKQNDKKPLPLLVFLHGAGQSAEDMLEYLGTIPGDAGIATLVPKSRDDTWDAVRSNFGADVTWLSSLLEKVLANEAIDISRIAIGGFSDGATYALSLGLINGDLFKKVVACSPGFIVSGVETGKPKFFISHGTRDPILPIDRCSYRIVAELKTRGYEVDFHEFNGRHEIPEDIAQLAMDWLRK